MTWDQLTELQRRTTLHAMVRFGGGFVSRLGEAWQSAHHGNAQQLAIVFPELVENYGPGSAPYARAKAIERA